MENETILLGMSGGVDSSYAALLLKEAGYTVVGAVLKMSDATDLDAAKKACDALEIPLHVIDCAERFHEIVIGDFLSEYAKGRTPNPCVVCNREVKIAALCAFAEENGIGKIATGHYAKIRRDGEAGRFYLERAADLTKDQSYMLWRLTQEQLSMLCLPLAEAQKSQIKADAASRRLPSAGLSESQEICFIPDNDHVSYIERATGIFPHGKFLDEAGNVLGEHKGIIRYTIGQRKGLGVSLGHPMFVSAIDAANNTVTLSDERALFRTELSCSALNFQKLAPGDYDGLTLSAKIRYAAKPEEAIVCIRGDTATVRFLRPVRAVTPGQSVVFYDGDDLCFGGFIDG